MARTDLCLIARCTTLCPRVPCRPWPVRCSRKACTWRPGRKLWSQSSEPASLEQTPPVGILRFWTMTVTLYSPFFRTALLPKFLPWLSKTVTTSLVRFPVVSRNKIWALHVSINRTESCPVWEVCSGKRQRQRQEKEEALDHHFDCVSCGPGVGDCRSGSDPRRHQDRPHQAGKGGKGGPRHEH